MPTENEVAEKFIYTALNVAGLTGLLPAPATITYGDAPQTATGAWVSIEQLGGTDHNLQDQERAGTEMQYLVCCVAEGRTMPGSVAAKIDELLHNKVSTSQAGYIVNCWRRTPYSWYGSKHGRDMRHEGGVYTIWVRRT